MTEHGRLFIAFVLVLASVVAGLAAPGSQPPSAEACAFLRTPYTYEADGLRRTYLEVMDAQSVDALFPGVPYWALPLVEVGGRTNRSPQVHRVPQSLIKAVGWVESNMTMAARAVPWEASGQALVSFDCGHGIMQVTTGMTQPLGAGDTPTAAQAMIATHYAYNIARGAAMLGEKWNDAPEYRPIAGTDTNSDPNIVENWYFAAWGYNGFTGPGSIQSNHPLDPRFANPRERFRCDGTQSRSRYPYQELVWGCMNSPPSVTGQRLWAPLPVSYPDLSAPEFNRPLAPSNFVYPYGGMDIPTPKPAHVEGAPAVAGDLRARVLGDPHLAIDNTSVQLNTTGNAAQSRVTVNIYNNGSGILSWIATPSAGWIVVDPPGGVALGPDVPCTGGAPCKREGTITLTVNPVLLSSADTSGSVRISATNAGGETITVNVNAHAAFETAAPGTSKAY